MQMSDGKEVFMVNDPVHGSIELRGKEIRLIIDTPEFQRLRKIKQLGGNCYVYPGANHTRFEHSIGVCYIASELIEHLRRHDKQAKVVLDEALKCDKKCKCDCDKECVCDKNCADCDRCDYMKCVKLAALCHDLGHGPYSHQYDIAVQEFFYHDNLKSLIENLKICGNFETEMLVKKLNDYIKKFSDANSRYGKSEFIECLKDIKLGNSDQTGTSTGEHVQSEDQTDTSSTKKLEDLIQLMSHEFRSVKIFKSIWNRCRLGNDKEKEEIGKMIAFSENYKAKKKELALMAIKEKLEPIREEPEELNQENAEELETKMEELEAKIEELKKSEAFKSEMEVVKDLDVLGELDIGADKAWLYEIVANGFSGIDVDKMDYFIRDGHYLGLSSFFNWRRYIQTLKVLEVEVPDQPKKIFRLCSQYKEAPELYQLFHIRTQLYRQAYYHKTTVGIEEMIRDALIKANQDLQLQGLDGLQILEAWKNPHVFAIYLTDSIEDIIMDKAAEGSKGIMKANATKVPDGIMKADKLFSRIKDRKLMTFRGEFKLVKNETEKHIIEKIEQCHPEFKKNRDQFYYKVVKFSYGMDKKDPVKKHYFYRKGNRPYLLPEDETFSEILPKAFSEKKVFLYYKPGNESNLEARMRQKRTRKQEPVIPAKIPSSADRQEGAVTRSLSRKRKHS